MLLPTSEPLELCAELEHGTILRGATAIRNRRSGVPIKRVFLVRPGEDPAAVLARAPGFLFRVDVPVDPAVLDAIHAADAVLFGPGSFYLSVIPNLLLEPIAASIRGSRARKVLICNLMTEPGQTDSWTMSWRTRRSLTAASRTATPRPWPSRCYRNRTPAGAGPWSRWGAGCKSWPRPRAR